MPQENTASVISFPGTKAKAKISFDIYQAVAGGMVSIDAVVPEYIAQAFLQMLRSDLLL